MSDRFSRTELLLGKKAMEILAGARVAVFGTGGVGSYAAEALARSGVGAMDLTDSDIVCESNINRQIIATEKTLGRYKVDVMKERILEINPEADVRIHRCFFLPETQEEFDFSRYSYVVDAVDTVTAKIELVLSARAAGVPVISCMGAGNKLDPMGFRVADLYETSVCPLAKVMRRELRKRGVERLKVVYSTETPVRPAKVPGQIREQGDLKEQAPWGAAENAADDAGRERRESRGGVPGSCAFVPAVAGLILAGEVIKDLIKEAGHSI